MITPITVDVQIARPQSFWPEAQLGDDSQTLRILWPDRDLDPMQLHHIEAVIHRQGDRGRDDPPTGEALIDPITDLGPGCRTADDTAYRQLPDQLLLSWRDLVVHQPRKCPARLRLPGQRSDQAREGRGASLRFRRKRCLPGSQPGHVRSSDPVPAGAITDPDRSQHHPTVPKGDRPVMPAEHCWGTGAPPDDPGRLMIKVPWATPAIPRLSTAVGTP